jgi:hypothetical protein
VNAKLLVGAIGDECLAERGTLPTCPILLLVWRQPRPAATRMLRGDSPEAKGFLAEFAF